MKIEITRTNSENLDFIHLVKELDAYLKTTDGDEHDFYNQFNAIGTFNNRFTDRVGFTKHNFVR